MAEARNDHETRFELRDLLEHIRSVMRVTQDRERQKALWTEAARLWFPDGAGSPKPTLIAIAMSGAQYWDGAGSSARHAMAM